MDRVKLTGIDGANPLGFLAALGLLRSLEDTSDGSMETLSLAWRDEGYWRPELHGVTSQDEVVDRVMRDLESWKNERVIEFAYSDDGRELDVGEGGGKQDLKPRPGLQRRRFDQAARRASDGHLRTARFLAAFGTDVAVDNNGNIKPTALHFTAGQQQFLRMVRQLRDGLRIEHVQEALRGPWTYSSSLPSLSWTGTGARLWALRASDPSKEKRGSCPGAEWLAFLGLSCFVCAPVTTFAGPKVVTTGVRGGWKDSSFAWPLWSRPAELRTILSLLQLRALRELGPEARKAYGVAAVLCADIVRSDQGGYGSFTPSRLI